MNTIVLKQGKSTWEKAREWACGRLDAKAYKEVPVEIPSIKYLNSEWRSSDKVFAKAPVVGKPKALKNVLIYSLREGYDLFEQMKQSGAALVRLGRVDKQYLNPLAVENCYKVSELGDLVVPGLVFKFRDNDLLPYPTLQPSEVIQTLQQAYEMCAPELKAAFPRPRFMDAKIG
jgi:hypothetical protein